jgi:hypothetical protein
MSEIPPADIAKLIKYIESQGVKCEYTPYGSFDWLELIIEDEDEIEVDTDSEISFWVGNQYAELDCSQLPKSFAGIRMANMLVWSANPGHVRMLKFHFEPSYYE